MFQLSSLQSCPLFLEYDLLNNHQICVCMSSKGVTFEASSANHPIVCGMFFGEFMLLSLLFSMLFLYTAVTFIVFSFFVIGLWYPASPSSHIKHKKYNTIEPTIHAVLQISAGGPYPAPINTSRHLYCLVWISSVNL